MSVDFDGYNLASGIYFYKLSVNDFTQTKKMVLLK
ncbi:MAG: T9SS type A sorting domain-containing protein [Ignavibacteria bacterium]|nr:T9SS type A sorting domain-containing protein [Ignavibacteria bacterium]